MQGKDRGAGEGGVMEWNAIAGDQRNAIAAGLELLERIAAGIESEQNRKLLPAKTKLWFQR